MHKNLLKKKHQLISSSHRRKVRTIKSVFCLSFCVKTERQEEEEEEEEESSSSGSRVVVNIRDR
jgi:hypothetical protein